MSIYLKGLRRGFWGWCRLRGFSDIFFYRIARLGRTWLNMKATQVIGFTKSNC